MIVNSIIKRIDVYRNYELNVELNMSIRRFYLGMEEQQSTREEPADANWFLHNKKPDNKSNSEGTL